MSPQRQTTPLEASPFELTPEQQTELLRRLSMNYKYTEQQRRMAEYMAEYEADLPLLRSLFGSHDLVDDWELAAEEEYCVTKKDEFIRTYGEVGAVD